jgi:hypothetical protein
MLLQPLLIISASFSAAVYAGLSAVTIFFFDMARHGG